MHLNTRAARRRANANGVYCATPQSPAEQALSICFATREPLAFASRLAATCSIDPDYLYRTVSEAREKHEEKHRALEALSELAMRADVLRHLSPHLSEADYAYLHTELCTFGEPHRERIRKAMRELGLGHFWEDVVVYSQRSRAR